MTTDNQDSGLLQTARLTGIWYLLLALSGLFGFLIFHSQIYVENPQDTLENLITKSSIARVRLIFEFLTIISQALAAVWFYKLFRKINESAAWALGIWGIVNSVAIMISAISMASAIDIANSTIHSQEEQVLLVKLLSNLIEHSWGVGSLFFGLWLIPMGYIVTSSKCMPLWLGRILIVGGFGYILSVFINYFGIDSTYSDVLVIPATIGEFWMIGYLLIFGIRETA